MSRAEHPGQVGVHVARGTVAELHARDLLGAAPGVWRMEPSDDAVVLGSAQPDGVVDRVAAVASGLSVCRRRSGGGLVLVERGDAVWIDVVVPRSSPRWRDDVHVVAREVGEVWSEVLRRSGADAEVHGGPMLDRDLGAIACFAGLGQGEVTVAGRKVVGLSQRRDRRGARVQCFVHRTWRPARLVALLGDTVAPLSARLADRLELGVAAVPDLDDVLGDVVDGLSTLTN